MGRCVSSPLGTGGGSMKRRCGAALPSWCGVRGKEEGFDPRRELRPAVRRESSDPSIGAPTQGSPSIFVRPPEYSSNSHWTADILPDDPLDDRLYEDATSFLPYPAHGIPVRRCVLLSTVREVPRGVVTWEAGTCWHGQTASSLRSGCWRLFSARMPAGGIFLHIGVAG